MEDKTKDNQVLENDILISETKPISEREESISATDSKELSLEELKAARKKKAKRFLKYAIIAISGGLIQLTAYIILSDAIKLDKHVSFDAIYQKQPWLTEIFYDPDTGKTYGLSYFIAVSLSVIWNFTFNRKYTFKSASNVPKAMLLFVLYYAFSIPFNCWAIVQLNKLVVFPLSDKVILICIMLANGLPAFFYQRYVVFGRSLDTKHKKKKSSDKSIEVVAAVIKNENGEIFCTQRNLEKPLGGKWEFPGGKIEIGETLPEALVREIKEEFDAEITVGDFIMTVEHSYLDKDIKLNAFWCKLSSGTLVLKEHNDYKWLHIKDIKDLDWADADIPVVNFISNQDNV